MLKTSVDVLYGAANEIALALLLFCAFANDLGLQAGDAVAVQCADDTNFWLAALNPWRIQGGGHLGHGPPKA